MNDIQIHTADSLRSRGRGDLKGSGRLADLKAVYRVQYWNDIERKPGKTDF